MRICLLAWGTRGDVQPIVALGGGLLRAGYQVTVAADPRYAPAVEAAGLRYDPFGSRLQDAFALLGGPLSHGDGPGGGRRALHVMRESAEAMSAGIADYLSSAVDHHDVFLSGVISFAAMLPVARETDKHHIMLTMAPIAPTRSGAATQFAVRPEGDSVLNLAVGRLGQLLPYAVVRGSIVETCARLDLPRPTLRRFAHDLSRTPQLLGVSPYVVPRPRDLPDRIHHTGYWVDPVDPSYAPPAKLADFLSAGPPPVYVGFGSMPTQDPAALFDVVVTALRTARRRGLVHGNWHGWRPVQPADDILLVDETPHEWLFPRTAGIVHHGGAGTTAAAVRAGIPQFVVPHLLDQPYWGRRVEHLGLGPPPVRRRALDAARLGEAISRLTGNPTFRTRAVALGARVRAEDGVTAAVTTIQRLLNR